MGLKRIVLDPFLFVLEYILIAYGWQLHCYYALKALSLRPKSIAISMQKHCLFYLPKLHSIRNLFRFIL